MIFAEAGEDSEVLPEAEIALARMMAAAIEARIQQERDVYLQNDSWMQSPQPGDWAGLIFNAPSQSYMENAVVEFAQRGIQAVGDANGALAIRDSVIRSNWLGILCSNSFARIEGATIYGQMIDPDAPPLTGGINPSGTGLMCIGTSEPVVSYSVFSNNEINSVGILGFARPSFGRISIANSPGRNGFRLPRLQNYMFNGTTQAIYAQMNEFELAAGETIEDTLYDDTDDPALGPIIYEPQLGVTTGVPSGIWGVYR